MTYLLDTVLSKVGPHGYVHGWIYVGAAGDLDNLASRVDDTNGPVAAGHIRNAADHLRNHNVGAAYDELAQAHNAIARDVQSAPKGRFKDLSNQHLQEVRDVRQAITGAQISPDAQLSTDAMRGNPSDDDVDRMIANYQTMHGHAPSDAEVAALRAKAQKATDRPGWGSLLKADDEKWEVTYLLDTVLSKVGPHGYVHGWIRVEPPNWPGGGALAHTAEHHLETDTPTHKYHATVIEYGAGEKPRVLVSRQAVGKQGQPTSKIQNLTNREVADVETGKRVAEERIARDADSAEKGTDEMSDQVQITLPAHITDARIEVHTGEVDHDPAVKALTATDRPGWGSLLKADDEKMVATYVAYPAMKADTAVAQDGHIDFAGKQVVEDAAHNWLAKGGKLGLWHRQSTQDYETVESGIHHGPDWVTKAADGSEQRICDGDWIVSVRAKNGDAWTLLKDQVGGTSPQGACKRREPDPETLAQLRS